MDVTVLNSTPQRNSMLLVPFIIDLIVLAYSFNCQAFLHQLSENGICGCKNISMGVLSNDQSCYAADPGKAGNDRLELHIALHTWDSDAGVRQGSLLMYLLFQI